MLCNLPAPTTNWDEYGSRTSSFDASASQNVMPNKFDSREAWEQYKLQQEALRASDPGQLQVHVID